MREAKVMQIFEGTNQIQRMVIGRSLDRTAGGACTARTDRPGDPPAPHRPTGRRRAKTGRRAGGRRTRGPGRPQGARRARRRVDEQGGDHRPAYRPRGERRHRDRRPPVSQQQRGLLPQRPPQALATGRQRADAGPVRRAGARQHPARRDRRRRRRRGPTTSAGPAAQRRRAPSRVRARRSRLVAVTAREGARRSRRRTPGPASRAASGGRRGARPRSGRTAP